MKVININKFKFKDLKYQLDKEQIQILSKIVKKSQSETIAMNDRVAIFLNQETEFIIYFFDWKLKEERLSVREALSKANLEGVHIESISLSQTIQNLCFISVYLSNKILLLYLIRF